MKRQFALVLLMVLCPLAMADSGLQGTWKIQSMACSSGVPIKGDWSFGIDGTWVFTDSQLTANMTVAIKITKESGDALLQQFQQAENFWKTQPDSPDKQKSLADIASGIKMIQQYENGFSCRTQETRSYTVNGSILHSNLINSSSDCPGNPAPDQSDDTNFSIDGTVMTSTDAGASVDGTFCPKGDTFVTKFVKVQ